MPKESQYPAGTPELADEIIYRDVDDPATSSGRQKRSTIANIVALAGGARILQPTGDATVDANAWQAALEALAAPGDIFVQGGTDWDLEAGIIDQAEASGYGIVAVGGRARITGAGTGILINWHDSTDIGTRTIHGGKLTGLDIDISGMGDGSTGVDFGDIYQFKSDYNVIGAVASGAASKNIYLNNKFEFAEEMTGCVKTQNGPLVYGKSGTGTSSFDRSALSIIVQTGGLCHGVIFEDGMLIADAKPGAGISGNTAPGAEEFAVLKMGAGARILGGTFDIGVEQNGAPGGGTPHATTTIIFDDDTGQIYTRGGTWDFGADQQMTSCAAPQQVAHGGTVDGDDKISPVQWGAASDQDASTGATLFPFPFGTIYAHSGGSDQTGLSLSPGSFEGQRVRIIAADFAGSLTFAASDSNVADGSADVIPALSGADYHWVAGNSLWYRVGGPGTFGGNLLVANAVSYVTGTFVGQSASGQYSNFNLADNVYPLDAAGHYWSFSHRDDHTLAIFNYNGSTYTALLSATEDGQLSISTAGKGLSVAEGSNAKQGTLTLNGTTAVVVSNTSVTANSRIFLTIQAPGGTVGAPYVSARSAGTSFSVKSTAAGDTSTCAYFITEPA